MMLPVPQDRRKPVGSREERFSSIEIPPNNRCAPLPVPAGTVFPVASEPDGAGDFFQRDKPLLIFDPLYTVAD